MAIAILMPALSPTMSEGNIAKWLKTEGDVVEPGQVIAEIETDKAIMEVESVDSGVIGKILVQEGSNPVKVNQLIAVLLEEGEDSSALNAILSKHQSGDTKQNDLPKEEVIKSDSTTPTTDTPKDKIANQKAGNRIFISPLAKRIAMQSNIDIAQVKGSGPNGRIIKKDIEEFITRSLTSQSALQDHATHSADNFSLQKLSNIRKTIANRLLEAKQTIPHFYLSLDCNVDSLMLLRQDLNDSAPKIGEKAAYKISVNDIVIKAAAKALLQVPEINSAWSNEGIILYHTIDISIAVAIADGLITPIIKNANSKSLSEISNEVKALAERAKNNRLKPEEYQGGGFSISNLGMYGIKTFNAIINPPQSAILAVGAVIKQPVVVDNEIRIGNIMNLTLSCDHRIVDGAKAATFLNQLKNIIEKPMLLMV